MDRETLWDFVWLAFDGRVGQVVLIVLALMSATAVGLTVDGVFRCKEARKDHRDFRRQVGGGLHSQNLDEMIVIAQSNKSPSAVVITSGLVAFRQTTYLSASAAGFEAAKRAATLSARTVRARMSWGLNHLASISATAPFVGIFGTCYGMLTAFKGCGCSMESLKAALAYEYGRALIPTALSYLVAVPAMWMHRFQQNEISASDLEMEAASLELVNYLAIHLREGD